MPGAKDSGLGEQSPNGLKLSPEGALPSQTGVFSAGGVVVEANSLVLQSSPQVRNLYQLARWAGQGTMG